MDLRIRHIIFNADKETKYCLDVHCKNTLLSLKKIIAGAANLNRKTLVLTHDGINLEQQEDHTLEQVFPTLSQIIFGVAIKKDLPDARQHQSITKINIGPKCERHSIKYPNHFCFTCNKSICNQCKEEDDHYKHIITDKMDFLSDSEVIVNDIFREITSQLRNLNIDNQGEVNNLRHLVQNVYFPTLIDCLKQIQDYILGYINIFENKVKVDRNNLFENVNNLESNCAEGLDELKNKISIKDILINEDIFLTMNAKLIQMSGEQNRIIKDGENYVKHCQLIGDITKQTEKIYNDIKNKLDNVMKFNEFEELIGKIKSTEVNRIDKEEIINNILRNTDAKDSHEVYTKDSRFRKSIFPSQNMVSTTPQKTQVQTQPEKNLDNKQVEHPERESQKANKFEDIFALSNSKKKLQPVDENINMASTLPVREQSPIKLNNNQKVQKEDKLNIPSTKQELVPSMLTSSSKKSLTKKNDVLIMRVFPESDKLAIYYNSTDQVTQTSVSFNPIIGIKHFYSNSHWICIGQKLYISGGMKEIDSRMNGSTIFLCYDNEINTVKRLADMVTPRHSHSSIHFNDFLYVVGGYLNNSCEKYDMKALKWKPFPNLNNNERQTPILHVHNSNLYAFFGYKVGQYLDTIERISLKSNKKWDVIPFRNPDSVNVKVVFSGIIPSNSNVNEVYFFGGKSHVGLEEVIRRDGFVFNFESYIVKKTDFELEEPTIFNQSQLIKVGKYTWADFNMKQDQLLKIELNR